VQPIESLAIFTLGLFGRPRLNC